MRAGREPQEPSRSYWGYTLASVRSWLRSSQRVVVERFRFMQENLKRRLGARVHLNDLLEAVDP
jgi:hypothetical protein